MATNQTFMQEFNNYDSAFDFMKMKNKAFDKAGNKKDIMCIVPNFDGESFAVVDLCTAVELGMGYVWSINGWVENPWTA